VGQHQAVLSFLNVPCSSRMSITGWSFKSIPTNEGKLDWIKRMCAHDKLYS
jgi:hypothetical protein